jgi:hypothetical protein
VPVFVRDDVRVLFVHVPKTGGSAVEDAFADAGWETHLLDRTSARHPSRRFRRCSPQHLHADLLEQLVRLERIDLVTTVVREPRARFRSEYLWRHGEETGPTPDEVTAWGRRILARYATDPFVRDNHIRPQTQFLLPGAHVHRYEDGLQAALDDVAAAVGGPAPQLRARPPSQGLRSTDVPVDAELERLLLDFYADDFARLGYPTGTG